MSSQFADSAFVPFDNIINDVNDLFALIDNIDSAQRFLFKGKEGTISQKASDVMPINLAALFLEIERLGLEPKGDSLQIKFLKDLLVHLRSLPQVKVTLAFNPTKSFITRLNSQISSQIGKKVILEIFVDQYIIGGAIFEYRGKIREYTLATKVKEAIEKRVKKKES